MEKYLLQVYHKKRDPTSFPRTWKEVAPNQTAVITGEGEYWFRELKAKAIVTDMILTDLSNNSRQTWRR